MTEGCDCLDRLLLKNTHTFLRIHSTIWAWNHSTHFSSSEFILETKYKQRNKPVILTHLAAALLLPTSPALNPPACSREHSWSTAGFPVTELPNKLHGSSRWFCFQTNGNFMDWSEFFFALSIPGATSRAVKIREAAKTQPREQHPPCLVAVFLPWEILLHFTGDSR